MVQKHLLKVLSLLLFLFACSENSTNEADLLEKEPVYNFTFLMNSYPEIGGLFTQFNFTIADSEGKKIDSLIYKIQLDLNNDGIYESNYFDVNNVKAGFTSTGKKKVNGKVLIGKSEFPFSSDVIVTELINILPGQNRAIFEPHIYNSKKIIITWGGYNVGGHALHMLDINGSYEGCIFCSQVGINIDEMHCSQLSFDGKKIFWDRGTKLYYYNFDTNLDYAPLMYSTGYYEPGKICWSLDSKKVFAVDTDGLGINSIDVNNNFNIDKITDFGKFVCIVPGNEDLIAIMEAANAISSDSIKMSNLKFFSLSQGKTIKEYNDIKGFNSFRVIDNGTKIFIEDPFLIYDLITQKYYNIVFDEVDLSRHMEGESDITIKGDKIIFSIFNQDQSKQNLYMFNIPINEL